MPMIDLKLEIDGCWPDLVQVAKAGRLIDPDPDETKLGLALLKNGMQSGKHSVTIRLDLPDGQVVLTQTSFELLELAVKAMRARVDNPHP